MIMANTVMRSLPHFGRKRCEISNFEILLGLYTASARNIRAISTTPLSLYSSPYQSEASQELQAKSAAVAPEHSLYYETVVCDCII
jgi:hypothetical protein